MKIVFASAARSDAAYQAHNPEDLTNFLVEIDGDRAKLLPVAGEEAFADTGIPLLSGLAEVNETLWCATGGKLIEIAADGGTTEVGAVSYDAETFISGNLNAVTVSAGGNLFVWDGAALSQVDLSAAQFQNVGTVGHLGFYTIITEKDGGRWAWSNLGNASSFDGLDFATAEADTDNLVGQQTMNGIQVLFGSRTTELWGLTGAADENAFQRLSGGVIEVGCLGPKLSCKTDLGIFFIGDDKTPYMLSGAEVAPLMDSAIMSDIEEETPDAVFYVEDRGHKLPVVHFKNRPARMYDFSQRRWIKRATGDVGPWAAVAAAKAYGQWFTGRNAGQVVKMARNAKDIGEPLIREAISRRIESGRDRFVVREIEFFGDFGDEDASMMFATSEDGRTFGKDRVLRASTKGEHAQRVVVRNLGQFRQMAGRIRMSDPVDMALDATAFVRAG